MYLAAIDRSEHEDRMTGLTDGRALRAGDDDFERFRRQLDAQHLARHKAKG